MVKHAHEKQERIIEAVRHGLEGEAAVEFVRKSGFAMTVAGIARHLRRMGGKGRIQDLIEQGRSNIEILEFVFPEESVDDLPPEVPSQAELFDFNSAVAAAPSVRPLERETRKISVRIPEDLYEAIRLAARAERKNQNDLIVDILTSALSRLPEIHEDSPPEKD